MSGPFSVIFKFTSMTAQPASYEFFEERHILRYLKQNVKQRDVCISDRVSYLPLQTETIALILSINLIGIRDAHMAS